MRLSSTLGVFLTIALVAASAVPSIRSSKESRVAGTYNGSPTSGSHGGVRPAAVGKQSPTPSLDGGEKGPSPPVESPSPAGQVAPPEGGFATGFPYKSGEKAPKKGSKSHVPSKGGSPAGSGTVPFAEGSQGGSPSKSAAALPSSYPSKSEHGAPSSVASSPSSLEAALRPISADIQPTGTHSGFFSKTENGVTSSSASPAVSTSSSPFKATLPTGSLSGEFQPTGSRTGYLPKTGLGTPSAVASPSSSASALVTEAAVPVQRLTTDTKPAELTGSQNGHTPKGDEGLFQGAHAEGSTIKHPGKSVHSSNKNVLPVLVRRNRGLGERLGPHLFKGGAGAGKSSKGGSGPFPPSSRPTGEYNGGPPAA
ncbi:hypothetical protein F5141DRAFT_296712 [Pisolithus sp. B1]|nr:hypothetical protein F5141DRAFT_296712 [Pisolithus sp. B1]